MTVNKETLSQRMFVYAAVQYKNQHFLQCYFDKICTAPAFFKSLTFYAQSVLQRNCDYRDGFKKYSS